MRIGLLGAISYVVFTAHASANITIACIGNSITERSGYTAILQQRLGASYQVSNYGYSGATMLREGNLPYWTTPYYSRALASAPDVVVLMLGTNDSKPDNWSYHGAAFARDYAAFIDTLRNLPSHPLILACLPPPAYPGSCCAISPTTIATHIVPQIDSLCTHHSVATIDLFTALSDKPERFPDGVHPDSTGAQIIAETIYRALIQLPLTTLLVMPKSTNLKAHSAMRTILWQHRGYAQHAPRLPATHFFLLNGSAFGRRSLSPLPPRGARNCIAVEGPVP